MLRIGFLPSDFNPMVLVLGEAEDFLALAGVLRQFARNPAPVQLDTLPFSMAGGTRFTLAEAGRHPGVELMAGAPVWRLDPATALRFAAQLETLADPGLLAGSEMLECGGEEEIPVKASRGEFTDDFLLRLARETVSHGGSNEG